MAMIGRFMRDACPIFEDRFDAGRQLADFIDASHEHDAVVLAIPRGGVQVAAPIADSIGAPLDVLLVRKLPVPFSPETGFGAVTIDGTVVLNEDLVGYFGISRGRIDSIVAETTQELARRSQAYSDPAGPLELEGRVVYIVDDGLATGYTVLAAARMARKHKPRRLTLAVPCSTADSVRLVGSNFDQVYCLVSQEASPFAVASFYKRFPDLTDSEVLDALQERRRKLAATAPRT